MTKLHATAISTAPVPRGLLAWLRRRASVAAQRRMDPRLMQDAGLVGRSERTVGYTIDPHILIFGGGAFRHG